MTPNEQHNPDYWDDYAAGGGRRGQSDAVTPQLQPALVRFAERALQESGIATGSTVLDVATGSGTAAVVLARAGMNVLATDFSATWIELVNSYRLRGLVAKQMDGQAMDVPDESFDAVFTVFGVTLFADWRAGLAEMYRVVRPGGIASVTTWASAGGGCAARALHLLCEELFDDVPEPVLLPGLAATRAPHDLHAELAAVGFEDIAIVEHTEPCELHRHELADPDRLFTFSSQWTELNRRQRARVVEVLAQRFPLDGPYAVPSTAAIATARRPAR